MQSKTMRYDWPRWSRESQSSNVRKRFIENLLMWQQPDKEQDVVYMQHVYLKNDDQCELKIVNQIQTF